MFDFKFKWDLAQYEILFYCILHLMLEGFFFCMELGTRWHLFLPFIE